MKKNKAIILMMILAIGMFVMMPVASAQEGIKVCEDSGIVKAFQIIGWCLLVMKIIAPLALIIVGGVELAKAVVSSDEKAIASAVSALVKKAIAAVVIFFIPTIVAFIMSLVSGAQTEMNKFDCLSDCIKQPGVCKVPSNEIFGNGGGQS